MAQNLHGHITTAKRADTVSEVLSANSLTSDSRFQTIRNSQTMTDKGTPKWATLRGLDGPYRFVLRLMMTRRIKS